MEKEEYNLDQSVYIKRERELCYVPKECYEFSLPKEVKKCYVPQMRGRAN